MTSPNEVTDGQKAIGCLMIIGIAVAIVGLTIIALLVCSGIGVRLYHLIAG